MPSPESILSRLNEDLQPTAEAKERVRAQCMKQIDRSALFERAKEEMGKTEQAQKSIWHAVSSSIDSPVLSGIFGQIKTALGLQSSKDALRMNVFSRIRPEPVRASYRTVKWVSAFAIFAIALRVSPVLFLAPATVAESAVMLIPTKGKVALSLHDLWQPVSSQLTLSEPLSMRTEEGEATIIIHDDGTVRLSPNTELTLHDVTDRPEPALGGPTLTLTHGRVWVQGLLSRNLRAITVATPYGTIAVHAGSVSIAVDKDLSVSVFDRHAVVMQEGTETILIADQRVRFGEGTAGSPVRLSEEEYADAWVTQNLNRDAVHRREVAQMQRERRAARAGILPTSALYPVKRVAEKVDVLLTLDPQQKVEKQLKQASVRLDEAAVLLAAGNTDAEKPLQEYKDSIVALASGTGGSAITQFLVKQEVAENTADLSSALPDDSLYSLKKAILETTVQLPPDIVNSSEIESVLLVDNLDQLHDAIESGNATKAEETYALIQPYIDDVSKADQLLPDVQKEMISLLTDAAQKLEDVRAATGTIVVSTIRMSLSPYLPKETPEQILPVAEPLTDEQIGVLVERMIKRVNVYSVEQAKLNQLVQELHQIRRHLDEGRILRRLLQSVEEDSLRRTLRNAIQRVRVEVGQ